MTRHTPDSFVPTERIIIHSVIGLTELGSLFDSNAPFKACRLCGDIYQSTLDHEQYALYSQYCGFPAYWFQSLEFDADVWRSYQLLERNARERRQRWEAVHNRRKHNNRRDQLALAHLHETGTAFTPEAAHKLTSYGIFPTGNKSPEIVHAMVTAPRAPINDPEGVLN